MPIKGFLRPLLARLGKIRLGRKAVSPNGGMEHPADLTGFRVPEDVAAVYGEEPTELDVMLPSANIDDWFPHELQRWGTGEKLLCRGDGECARCWSDEAGGWTDIPCGYQECPFYGKAKGQGCTERGSLMVFLPRVSLNGVYQIDTGSWYGMSHIHDEFRTLQTMLTNLTGNPDIVRAVRFKLTREVETVNYYDGTARKSVTKALLHLRAPNLSEEKALQLAAQFRGGLSGPLMGDGSTLPVPELGPAEDDELPMLPPAGDLPDDVLDEIAPDLVAGASPTGPDMGQRVAFAALQESVNLQCEKLMGLAPELEVKMKKRAANFESVLARAANKDASKFADLDGATEAPQMLERAAEWVAKWQEELEAEQALRDDSPPVPQPEPDFDGQPEAEPAPAAAPMTDRQVARAATKRTARPKPPTQPEHETAPAGAADDGGSLSF
jgi:hypothetical protein